LTRADRRAQRHHRNSAQLLQLFCEHRIRVDVGQDLESLGDEDARSDQRLLGVGEEVARVGDDLELDPIRQSHRPGKASDPDRLICGAAPSGVGKDAVTLPVDDVEDRLLLGIVEVEAPESHRHQLAPGRLQCRDHRGVVRILSGAEEESRAQLDSGDDQLVDGGNRLHGSSLPSAAPHKRAATGCGPEG